MNLGLLIVPALAGYWLLDQTCLWQYQLRRESGYSLFFKSAIAGLVLVATARIFCVALEAVLPYMEAWAGGYVKAWAGVYVKARAGVAPFEHSDTVVLTAVFALVAPPILNCIFNVNERAKRTALTNGDLVEWVVQDSLDHPTLVEISLRSGKSYIGLATHSGVSTSGPTDIALIPFASGYRDRRTHELTMTTYYSDTLSGYEGDLEDFQVVVPRAEIASARKFIPGVWRASAYDRPTARAPKPATPLGAGGGPQ